MYKSGVSLTTAAVEIDGGNQTKKMTEAEQMNDHRADERSPSSGNAASRRLEDKKTEKARTEKSSSTAREKAEEPERVQVELKETEKITNVASRVAGLDRLGHLLTQSKPTPAEAHRHWVREKKDWAVKLKKILGEVGPKRPTELSPYPSKLDLEELRITRRLEAYQEVLSINLCEFVADAEKVNYK
ncbi:hypothetical protein M9H77_23961 [Catharanthus roseus]|uniref:Uncharacterized protein n=1 Tax=Catharanthus roseus TaxID=4058 RepID=A0ACC0AXI5_CATRO|nr:hypothetical protein M9H77_23961 [Catharanthus roseus]